MTDSRIATSRPLKPGRYCEHGAVVPGPTQVAYVVNRLSHKDEGSAIACCIDWCDICTGIARRVEHGRA